MDYQLDAKVSAYNKTVTGAVKDNIKLRSEVQALNGEVQGLKAHITGLHAEFIQLRSLFAAAIGGGPTTHGD